MYCIVLYCAMPVPVMSTFYILAPAAPCLVPRPLIAQLMQLMYYDIVQVLELRLIWSWSKCVWKCCWKMKLISNRCYCKGEALVPPKICSFIKRDCRYKLKPSSLCLFVCLWMLRGKRRRWPITSSIIRGNLTCISTVAFSWNRDPLETTGPQNFTNGIYLTFHFLQRPVISPLAHVIEDCTLINAPNPFILCLSMSFQWPKRDPNSYSAFQTSFCDIYTKRTLA